jgi:hypothetical protein
MKELTASRKRFERIKTDRAIIKWVLAVNIVGLLLILLMVNG